MRPARLRPGLYSGAVPKTLGSVSESPLVSRNGTALPEPHAVPSLDRLVPHTALLDGVPGALELIGSDRPARPVLHLVEPSPPKTTSRVLFMTRAVLQGWSGVVDLDLSSRPAILTNFEVPSTGTPRVALIASRLIPAAFEVPVRHSRKPLTLACAACTDLPHSVRTRPCGSAGVVRIRVTLRAGDRRHDNRVRPVAATFRPRLPRAEFRRGGRSPPGDGFGLGASPNRDRPGGERRRRGAHAWD